jgi:hypothetical protein
MHFVLNQYVVADHKGFLMEEHMTVKIMENEEPGIVKPRTSERIRNPGIEVTIGLRRRVIGNHRGAIVIIIIVNNLGARIRDVVISLGWGNFVGWPRGNLRSNRSPNRFDSTPVFLGDGFIPIGEMNNSVSIGVFINDRIPALTPGDELRGSRLRVGARSNVQSKLGLKILNRPLGFILSHP